ncbi:MAG TPA: hypothetical protein VFQ61_09740 [Polyangiaceae bacterium]|nr:hypothetical protein [Polyangiaceae bacterium]
MLQISSLNDGWQFMAKTWLTEQSYGFSRFEWLPAHVPGHVHLDLVANGVIAHPFEAQYELGCRWVDEEDFVYRRTFSFEPDPELPQTRLVFRGLDGVCSVFLNDAQIAEHDNMFVPLELDVSDKLQRGKNQLRLEFQSAARVGRERRARYFAAEGIPEQVLRFDERAFVRKAQYMFGWDWGPRLISCGLWADVELQRGRGRIVDVHVTQTHLPNGSVELEFRSELEGQGQVVHEVEGVPGRVADGEKLLIERPNLWWPAGLGPQFLYAIRSWLLPTSAAPDASLADSALDCRSFRVGLRRVRLLQEPDALGSSFEFEVNGRKLWAVGANWIPDSSFPAQVDRARVRAQVERARDMNMNMLRVWGGGLYESDDFYDACDELGVLVWQDFPFACSYYPDDESACVALRREASVNVKRLRNRASLALWCGNNENLTMWEDKWGEASRHPARYYGERLYDEVLPALLRELDPNRPYIPSSPFAGVAEGKANAGGSGDQHYWDVWHGRGDWKHYADSTGRFASEFGFAAAPSSASLRRLAPNVRDVLALPVRDAMLRWHDKTSKGYETFIGYVEQHYPAARNAEEWIYYSQLNQRDALRFGIEHYRRSEFCKGSVIWQLNDCWPVQSWAVLDDCFQYKAAAFELRRLYAPALVSLEMTGREACVWAILDNASEPLLDKLQVQVHSLLDGRTLHEFEQKLELMPGDRRVITRVPLERFDPKTSIVSARFHGRTTFRLLDEPKNVRLSAPRLNARFASGRLMIESDVPVVDLCVWDEAGSLVLKDNFVTVPSGGSCATLFAQGVPGHLRARSLQGHHAIRVSSAR